MLENSIATFLQISIKINLDCASTILGKTAIHILSHGKFYCCTNLKCAL